MASIRSTIVANIISEMEDLRTDATFSNSSVKKVSSTIENIQHQLTDETSFVMVVDTGNEIYVVPDPTHTRYSFDVEVLAYVKGRTTSDGIAELNNIIADVKQWVNAGPSLGSNVFAIDWIENTGSQFDGEHNQMYTTMLLRVVYWAIHGTY